MRETLRAFTLIELLVVIAIIGILAAIAVSSLTLARNKAFDTAIKQNIENARSAAELYYSNNSNSYGAADALCGATSGVQPMVAAILVQGGAPVCHSSDTAWALSASLRTNTAEYFCMDNIGSVKIGTTALGNNLSCP